MTIIELKHSIYSIHHKPLFLSTFMSYNFQLMTILQTEVTIDIPVGKEQL